MTRKQARKEKGSKQPLNPKMIKILKWAGLSLATVILMTLVYFGEQAGVWFKASVLDAPQPFNGTVYPVSKVPNWTHWNTQSNERFDQIPKSELIDLPKYDLSKMQFPDSQLVWGDSSQDSIRNTKIIYPVVYLGNYEYDHQEDVGSHLAIDIKMPMGTPVMAIANGKVVKTSTQGTGFGHHVVIKHPNVPDPENPGKLTTLYSAYNHMDRIDVQEGQNVLKGQIVGTSGNTGTSTTPHLHFQLDRDSAPWHPYWPFSWKESQDAGLSFFEAVNAGLGLSKGRKYTVNPMAFVAKNLNFSAVASNNGDNPVPNPEPEPIAEVQPETAPEAGSNPEPVANPEPAPEPEPQPTFRETGKENLFEFKITGERVSLVGNGLTLIVTDELEQVKNMNDTDRIKIEHTGAGQLLRDNLSKDDFKNGSAKVVIRSTEEGSATVTIGKSSYTVSFINEVRPASKLHIEHDGYYQENIVEKMQVIALDENGNVSPAVNFTGVVNVRADRDRVRIMPENLSASDFKNGVAEVRVVISGDEPVNFKAQNGALLGDSASIRKEEKEVFTDIRRNHPNYEAIKYLKDHDIVNGYSDGSFKPDKTVNRAEALKMLMLAFNVDVGGPFDLHFNDVDKGAWYASTLATAVARGIVKGYQDGTFKPANTVNRAEYLKVLFATNNIKPSENITKPYDDVSLDDWFAGYAFLANKMNILGSRNKFNASKGMTRAMVAETIYRMKTIQEDNLMVYSK